MLEVSAASINSMWRGQSEKNVRALFFLIRELAPAVIFLDEADSLLGARHGSRWLDGVPWPPQLTLARATDGAG